MKGDYTEVFRPRERVEHDEVSTGNAFTELVVFVGGVVHAQVSGILCPEAMRRSIE